LLAQLGLPPLVDIAGEVVNGKNEPPGVQAIMGEPAGEQSKYELEEVRTPDGDINESPSPGGGGLQMADLVLPEQRLLNQTRLKYIDDDCRPKIIIEDSDERFVTYEPAQAAGWLVNRGY
jgi:hypothetical protein